MRGLPPRLRYSEIGHFSQAGFYPKLRKLQTSLFRHAVRATKGHGAEAPAAHKAIPGSARPLASRSVMGYRRRTPGREPQYL